MTPGCEDSPAGDRRMKYLPLLKGGKGEVVSGFGEDEISESRSLILTYQRYLANDRSINGCTSHRSITISNLQDQLYHSKPKYQKKKKKIFNSGSR